MNKSEFIEKFAARSDMTRKQAEMAYQAFVSVVKEAVIYDGSIQITGLGTLKISKRLSRKGRNPKTGETIEIKESSTAKFTPNKNFKQDIDCFYLKMK